MTTAAANTALDNLGSLKDALPTNDDASPAVDDTIVYSEEELQTMREVKKILEQEDDMKELNPRFLAYTVVVSKNRVDESVKKIRQYLKAIAPCGVESIETDLWSNGDSEVVEQFLRDYYPPCGVDSNGRQIMWIKGGKPITADEEKIFIRASTLFVLAIHADVKSLREGVTFVIDTSKNNTTNKVGNESKLQKINQSYPLRPQHIYLAGASFPMRIVINGLIKIASLFTKQKILQRIKFVTLEEAMNQVPKESGPEYLGGGGGGIDDIVAWVKTRYDALPVPSL